MPAAADTCREEAVIFENWEAEGAHIFVGFKYLLTMATPESSRGEDGSTECVEDWVSPEEFCKNLSAIVLALGPTPAILAEVEREAQHYRDNPVNPPRRSRFDPVPGV